MSSPIPSSRDLVRVIVCGTAPPMVALTALLRDGGCCVFQAYNGAAAVELCQGLQEIGLLVLDSEASNAESVELVRAVRQQQPDLPILHIGAASFAGMPADVAFLTSSFTPAQLLAAVHRIVSPVPSIAREAVLIVDDIVAGRRMLVRALSGHGFDVLEASNGLDALNVLEIFGARVCMVIADIRMPTMDGVELWKQMRGRFPQPMIFMSAFAPDPDLPPVPLLSKPFDIGALLAMVQGHIAASRLPAAT